MKAVLLVILGGILIGLYMAFGVRRSAKKRRQAEVQKLLALAAREGTLTPAMIQAALGYTKAGADAALLRLRNQGLAELDLEAGGDPVYRVPEAALQARKHKGF